MVISFRIIYVCNGLFEWLFERKERTEMIAIKGMEMPTSCKKCMLNNIDSPWFGLCRTTGNNVIEYKDSRHPNCPLVEIVTCEDCDHCRFELVEGIPYYWCDKDDRVTSEDYYCADGERRK